MIGGIAVVIPAHNEEYLLGQCLESVRRAARHPALAAVQVQTIVVADSCHDQTAAIGHRWGARVLPTESRSAGLSRRRGSAFALSRLLRALAPQEAWLAHTDADSRVPGNWLAAQLGYAARGFHAMAGTIEVDDWSQHPPHIPAAFLRRYRSWTGSHPHVHGANLGVRADAYRAAGGFPGLAIGEDHALVTALEAAGYRIHRTDRNPVRTSARRDPRAAAGFGDFLRHLNPDGETHGDGETRAAAPVSCRC